MKLQSWDPDLRSLVDRIERGAIDLQPDFQRQEIWSRTKQRRLIDTILREWSIPPVHFVVTGDSSLEVLDGQQRLAAIRDFFRDEFAIDGTIAPSDQSVSKLHGLRYSVLPLDVRYRIDQYTLRSFRLSEFKPQEPSELFYRLNQPVSLTAGEKRNALYGQARGQLKELVSEFSAFGNSLETLGFSNSRMSYDDILARLIFFVERGSFAVKAAEAAISDRFRDETGFPESVIAVATKSIAEFSKRREAAGRVKLNKASLLSWLLFYSRSGAEETATGFLRKFEEILPHDGPTSILESARRVFVDRSSLRVTDVSSVVYRDVALWLAYHTTYRQRALPLDRSVLSEVEDRFGQGRRARLDAILDEVIEPEQWARI